MLIVVAGIHGNEPAGVRASERVLAQLPALARTMRGDAVFLAGNLGALARDVRFIDRDLNRQWDPDQAPEATRVTVAEDREQRELAAELEAAAGEARGPVYVLDLHTTSADGVPFAMIAGPGRERSFALHFPLAVILGLLDRIEGTLLAYVQSRGWIGLGVEAGQHARAVSVDRHEAVLWIALTAAGLLPPAAVPDLADRVALLEAARRELPRILEVEHRHAIRPEDEFRMEPGFANLQRIRAGELLARDRTGEIRAPRSGVLVMPLYQPQGDDGFFLGRALDPLDADDQQGSRRSEQRAG